MAAQHFARGSEWRKWDLHIHGPGTKLSDNFGKLADWDEYCRLLEESDVAVIGITDYFSLDCFFAVRDEFKARYPNSKKVLMPNLELRLNEVVTERDQVHLHLIFRPDLKKEVADRLLANLRTETRDPSADRPLCCSELTSEQIRSAMVSRDAVKHALRRAFGEDLSVQEDSVVLFVPANNDGIRSAKGSLRKAANADVIDRWVRGIFGNPGNVEYFLDVDRSEDDEPVPPRPVFSGCDAHSTEEVRAWLGHEIDTEGQKKYVTWVKADPTFEGLLQTLVEPEARVRIQASQPDFKEPYKYIRAVHFGGTDEFPSTVPLNQNLVSIIGSRSSGKSSLLAYIAHAVDPEETIARQIQAGSSKDAKSAGPAAGHTWADVESIERRVEWGASEAQSGRVIYVPQNSLYAISERPEEITAKILPTLYRCDESFRLAHQQMVERVSEFNGEIRAEVESWFRLSDDVASRAASLLELGDPQAITQTRDAIAADIERKRGESSVTANEGKEYQEVIREFARIDSRQRAVSEEKMGLASFVERRDSGYVALPTLQVGVDIRPGVQSLPDSLALIVQGHIEEARQQLQIKIGDAIVDYTTSLDGEFAALVAEKTKLELDKADLIAKNKASSEIEPLVQGLARQEQLLKDITAKAESLHALRTERDTTASRIAGIVAQRNEAIDELEGVFLASERKLDSMTFGIERSFSDFQIGGLVERLNRRAGSDYYDSQTQVLDVALCQKDVAEFLNALRSGRQKLKSGASPAHVAVEVLTTTEEVRFYAEIDGDRVGGFKDSSMTPGKQALFALTLILNESEEAWPLLIDQPEDDLDSRSIYESLVKYLCERKQDRQIIMVSHNANLVVGADSEQVIVANRHGDDRPNRNDQHFDYFSGSLEHSRTRKDASVVFDRCGIREHACDILDGGEEAFRKRQEKYKL